MIRTVLTLRMGSQDMQDTTFLINDTQIGFLAPGGRRNHVLSSNRYIQLIAGFRAEVEEPSQTTAVQRDNLRLWQRCSRDVQQRGLDILAQAAVHYRLRPDWLVGLDDTYLHAWLLDRYAIYLMRQGELFQVEPVSDQQVKIPELWYGHLHQSIIEIMEGDYYLFLPPDFFQVVTPEEVQTILSGLQQLSVKINELVELARLRKYNLNDTWMALQVQRIEADSAQPVSLREQWSSFRQQLKKPRAEEVARQKARNSSLRQTTSLPPDVYPPDYAETPAYGFKGDSQIPDIDHAGDPYDPDRQELASRRKSDGRPVRQSDPVHYKATDRYAHRPAASDRQPARTAGRTGHKTEARQGLVGVWLGWRKEKRLLSVIVALALIILLAWGITALVSGGKNEERETETSATTAAPTPTPLPPTSTTTMAPPQIQMVVNVRSLNFREQPGRESNLITTLAEGSVVTMIEDAGEGWVKVLLPDGVEAYAFAEYLSEAEADASAEQTNET